MRNPLEDVLVVRINHRDFKVAFINMFKDSREKVVILREQIEASEEKWKPEKKKKSQMIKSTI